MKSKQDDAKLIAEAYAEVQEEAIGALAAGIGRGAAAAGRGAAAVAKKVAPIAGKAIKKTAKIGAGAVLGAAEGAAEGAAQAVGGLAKGAVQGATGAVQGAIAAASDEEGEKETKTLEVKVADAEAKGDIDKSDAAQIMRSHYKGEDAEHAAPEEVDMSQNPDPESLEVTKEVEVEVPSIHPDVDDKPHVNHHDDSEMKMALAELYKIEKYAFGLSLMLKEMPALEGWTAAKITKAADYLGSVFHKLDYDFASGDHADGVEDSE